MGIRWMTTLAVAILGLNCCETGKAPTQEDREASAVDIGQDSILDLERTSDQVVEEAFLNHTSNIQVLVRGTVSRILADDVTGDAHQRFVITLDSKRTLLVAHNIDLADRVPGLKPKTLVYVKGEYEWNEEGGVVHWTHIDPGGKHAPGWIQYFGFRYQ